LLAGGYVADRRQKAQEVVLRVADRADRDLPPKFLVGFAQEALFSGVNRNFAGLQPGGLGSGAGVSCDAGHLTQTELLEFILGVAQQSFELWVGLDKTEIAI